MATTGETKKEASGPVISGGHLVAKALKNEGVDVIWTLCGGHIIDIYDGCIDEGIKIIDVRHEQVAAHAADGYSRQSGKIGCVVTTAGPGTTNAMTGIANAFRAESPLLMIGGQGALSQHKMGSLQDLPHVDIMSPITKFAATVPHTERIADMVSMAFRESVNGAPGPSYLEIPRDVLDAKVPLERARIPKPGAYRASTKSVGDPADIEKLADILAKSERPAALFGTQVWTCRGHDAAVEFCRALNVPGYMNGSGRGIFAPGDPHGFNRTRSVAFDKADVILIVGCPFDFRLGLWQAFARRCDRRADRSRLSQRRQEPRHFARHGRRLRRDSQGRRAGRDRPRVERQRAARRMDERAARRGSQGIRKTFAVIQIGIRADQSLSGRLRDQRIS